MHVPIVVNSDNTRKSTDDPEKGPLGVHTQFLVNNDPEFRQLSVNLTKINDGVRLTQLWVIFRVIVDPEWSLTPIDPFRVKYDSGVFIACI